MRGYLGRRYHFSAAHRLHAAGLTEEENRAAYGKCNNPFGHGHNYVVEVVFGGKIDGVTGMVTDLGALDEFARRELLGVVDFGNLNELEMFAGLVPTTENLTVAVHRIFSGFAGAELVGVHVEETGKNGFDLGERMGFPLIASSR